MKITQNYFNKILEKNYLFETHPKIAVAVSGGPDSMALVFLLQKWIKKKQGSLIALIIDHQIRKESNLEAIKIKKYLFEHQIKSQLFVVNKKDVIKKTMSEARDNRFSHLLKFCLLNNILHLFIGHHSDDNIETFLLRKIAGSNIEGLFGIHHKVNMRGLQILRPLLEFDKEEILKYDKENCIYFIKDPSNNNIKYSRIVVREFLSNKIGYKKQIEKEFKKIINYYPLYKKMIFQIFNKLNIKTSKSNMLLDGIIFFKQDQEIQTKIIEIVFKFLKPKREVLRYKKILNLLIMLKSRKAIKTNFAGMSIKKDVFFISFTA